MKRTIKASINKQSYILNLTQHRATNQQLADKVIDLDDKERSKLIELLTFDELPTSDELFERASQIAMLAHEFNSNGVLHYAMIGGAPYLMPYLESALADPVIGMTPLYSFSKRESVEKVVNGEVIKTSVFKHIGFVQ